METALLQTFSFLVSALLGIGGLIVAALSAHWAQATRLEPFKKLVYERQTAAADECLLALVALENVVEEHHRSLGSPNFFEHDDDRDAFAQLTQSPTHILRAALYRWSAVLPYEVFMPMTQYVAVVEYVAGKRSVADGWLGAGYPIGSPWTYLPGYFLESVAAVREFLGVDPLSKHITQTLGMSPARPSHEAQVELLNKRAAPLGYLMSIDYRKPGTWTIDRGYVYPWNVEAPQGVAGGERDDT